MKFRMTYSILLLFLCAICAGCTGNAIPFPTDPPAVTINAIPSQGDAPLEVHFNMQAELASGATISKIEWTFGNGATSSEQDPVFTYSEPGDYTARCFVTDSYDKTGDSSIDILVTESGAPIVNASANPTSGSAPLLVQFSVTVTLEAGATLSTIDWSFGDGTSNSSEQNPQHTYQAIGNYDVVCTVMDSRGKIGRDNFQVIVMETPDYVGSAQCQTCHSAIHGNWITTGHHFILNKISGAAPTLPYTSVPNPPSSQTWSGISYVIGGFLNKALFMDSQGKIITGPDVQWNLDSSQFAGYQSSAPGTDDYTCGKCHSTGWLSFTENGGLHQDNLARIMGTWNEPGVACEACHGAGSNHIANPSPVNIIKDRSASRCGKCHGREPVTQIFIDGNLALNYQQYNQFLASPHSVLSCATCHDPHASTAYDDVAPGSGIAKPCTTCHQASTHQVSGGMSGLECIDCHMPFGMKSATSQNTDVNITGDLPSHIWAIDITGTTFADYFLTDGPSTWIKPDANNKVKLNLAWTCMQCHDGTRAFKITSYALAVSKAAGIHN